MPDNPPRVRVTLFAGMAEAAGRRSLELPWTGGTVADLRHRVAAAVPAIAPLLAAIALGDRYAKADESVAAGADVAIIPPVSGG